MLLLHSLLPQWPGNSVCRRLGDLISGVFFTNYTHPPAGTCFHTVRSLFISASLCSANCGASFTPRSNLKLYHVPREARLIVWLASFHINMWMLTEHQSHTSSWRRRGEEERLEVRKSWNFQRQIMCQWNNPVMFLRNFFIHLGFTWKCVTGLTVLLWEDHYLTRPPPLDAPSCLFWLQSSSGSHTEELHRSDSLSLCCFLSLPGQPQCLKGQRHTQQVGEEQHRSLIWIKTPESKPSQMVTLP